MSEPSFRVNTIPVDFSVAGRILGSIQLADMDDLYYRFERGEGSGTLTGELDIGFSLSITAVDEPHGRVALNLDGDQHDLDIEAFAFALFIVKTAQSGQRGSLHLYARKRAIKNTNP